MNARSSRRRQHPAFIDAAEEARLVRLWQKRGDTAARNALVTAHMRIAHYWAARYRKQASYEDMVQEGALGLMRAADTFDVRKGYRFSTYAIHWVRYMVGRAAFVTSTPVRLPSKMQLEWSRAPHLKRAVSLDAEPRGHERDDHRTRLGALLDDGELPDDGASRSERRKALNDAMHMLDDRDQVIIAVRATTDCTLDDLGRRFDVSRERVRQIEADALDRMRDAVRVMEGESVPKVARARRRWVSL